MIILKLPYPPSVNNYYRKFRNIMVMSKAGRDFKEKVQDYVLDYRVPKLGKARLELTIWLYPPTRRQTDLDNRLKAILDSLQDAGVYDDDSQIDVLMIQRGKIIKDGGCTVFIEYAENC
jgi:crossover junction endodeoxyribonuclease RusA